MRNASQGFTDGLEGEFLIAISNGELLAIHARDANAKIVWIGVGQRRDLGRHRAFMVVAVLLMEMRQKRFKFSDVVQGLISC